MNLLAIRSAVSFALAMHAADIVRAILVVLSVGLRFWREVRTDGAAAKLKAIIHVISTVIRDSQARDTADNLVPGDIIQVFRRAI